MTKNVGGVDRLFRFAVGFVSILGVWILEDLALRLVFGLVGLIGLGTSLGGYCPINHALGMNTAEKKKKP